MFRHTTLISEYLPVLIVSFGESRGIGKDTVASP